MKKFALINAAMEELEIDKAIEKQEIETNDTPEAVISKIETEEEKTPEVESTEPTAPATEETTTGEMSEEPMIDPLDIPETASQQTAKENSVAAESMIVFLERSMRSCASLEAIADILESSKEIGGVSVSAAGMAKLAVESIYKDLDIPQSQSSNIAVESFSSMSSRQKLSMGAMEDIRKKISEIWQMIMNGLKAVIEFIRKAIVAYRSDMGKQKQDLENNRDLYRVIKKVDPAEPELKGVLYQTLLADLSQGKGSSDVLSLGKSTLDTIDSYIVTFRRNLSSSIEAINAIGDELVSIDGEFKKEDVVKFGKIFGIHQSPVFEKKPEIAGFKKFSNTMSCYETPMMAGNMKLVSFTGTEANLNYEDIVESKCQLAFFERTKDNVVNMDVCEESDFRKMFELIDEAIRVSVKSYEVMDVMEKSILNIMKVIQALESKFVKANTKETNDSRAQTMIYSRLAAALQAFYVKPVHSVLRYNNRYVKALNAYCFASLKMYE